MPSDETRYTNKVFMAGALPLLKTIANDVPELKKKFEGVNAIYQVSAKVNAEDKEAIHFIIENGEWTVKLGEYLGQEKIDAGRKRCAEQHKQHHIQQQCRHIPSGQVPTNISQIPQADTRCRKANQQGG